LKITEIVLIQIKKLDNKDVCYAKECSDMKNKEDQEIFYYKNNKCVSFIPKDCT